MNYQEKELKQGIKLHTIQTDKFKTNLIAVFLTTKLEKETVTKNAVISAVLRRGSKNMQSQEEISKKLEEMYGASFDCGIDKIGDNQILKFYIETINDNFLPNTKEDLLKTSLEKILEIVFNPYMENGKFKQEYVEQEKANIKQRIEGKVDNKARYALERCVEIMYENKPYGIYKLGYSQDVEKIDANNLSQQYEELIKNCKIDIFVSGKLPENVEEILNENENIKNLQARTPQYIEQKINQREKSKENIVTESMDVAQGKLVIGLDVNLNNDEEKYHALMYNSILGGSANSKLFQNVREKANLAYVASSTYTKTKDNIFINCGIEISNYEKALDIIKQQIKAMEQGEFDEEEIENAKKGIISTIETIDDEQDTGITYFFGQELSKNNTTVQEYIQKIQDVTKQQILEIAKKVNINTIFFLRD